MGIIQGRFVGDDYRPSLLYRLLRPRKITGNEINGLGEKGTRQPTPVAHYLDGWTPFNPICLLFNLKELIQGYGFHYFIRSRIKKNLGFKAIANEQAAGAEDEFTPDIKTFALSHPACEQVGIAPLTRDLIFDKEWAKGKGRYRWIIVLAKRMDYEMLSSNLTDEPAAKPWWRRNWNPWRRKWHPMITTVYETYFRTHAAAFDLANYIRSKGYAAEGFGGADHGCLTVIPAAIRAGMGELGKHGSMISPELGSAIRLSYVMTDMPLSPDQQKRYGIDEFCQSCQACTNACPVKAIDPEKQLVRGVEKWYVNFDRCLPYWSDTRSCAICLSVCPWARPGVALNLAKKTLKRIQADMSPTTSGEPT